MGTIIQNFDSVFDYVAFVTDKSRTIPHEVYQAHDDSEPRDFFWTRSFNEALGLWRTGWSEGAERVAQHRRGFDAFIQTAKNAKSRQAMWDVTGEWWDEGRIATGEPECCASEIDLGDKATDRVVSIRLNNSVSSSVDANIICARGLAVLVAVDLLESCGIRCEVVVGTSTKQGGVNNGIVETNVTVKKAGEQVEPSAIAFNVAHPSFFRRFGFRFMELHGQSPCMNYPRPMTDCGSRNGVVEIDEILSEVRLSHDRITKNVLKIAEKCGLVFAGDEIEQLVAAASM